MKDRLVKYFSLLFAFSFLGLAAPRIALGEKRLITTSPALTELIFQLGHGAEIVGAAQYSDYPEAAKRIPRIGSTFLPSLEKIVALRPDWILVDTAVIPISVVEQWKRAKLHLFLVNIQSVADLFSESQTILKEMFHEKSFEPLASAKEEFRSLGERARAKRPFRFLAMVWHSPVFLVGARTFLSDLLSQVGGENLSPKHILTPYPQVSEEWVIKHRPDVLLILSESGTLGSGQRDQFKTMIKKWWPGSPPKVIPLPSEHFARTSLTPIRIMGESLGKTLGELP